MPSANGVKKFTVVEGNRRIASLKILSNPELIEDKIYANLKKKFKTLYNNNIDKFPISVPCIVLKDEKEAEIWIGIKHGGLQSGIGTDGWDPRQKDRFELKTKGISSISLQFINFLKNAAEVPVEIKQEIDSIKTSNVDRLLGDPYVRNKLGIDLTNGILRANIEEGEVAKGLSKIAKDLLTPKFTVSNIYSDKNRKAYIDAFTAKFIPDTKKVVDKPWQLSTVKNAAPRAATSQNNNSSSQSRENRTKLIPKKVLVSISQPRLSSIYTELQTLDINTHKNAVAVLFRVFIELSLDYFIEQKKLTQATSSQRSGLGLKDKAFQVISNLTNRNLIDTAISKGIRNAVKDDNGLLGTETWHAYVHNHRFSPIPANMIITWDSLQDFVTILWNDLA